MVPDRKRKKTHLELGKDSCITSGGNGPQETAPSTPPISTERHTALLRRKHRTTRPIDNRREQVTTGTTWHTRGARALLLYVENQTDAKRNFYIQEKQNVFPNLASRPWSYEKNDGFDQSTCLSLRRQREPEPEPEDELDDVPEDDLLAWFWFSDAY